jgi:hypothetical protein
VFKIYKYYILASELVDSNSNRIAAERQHASNHNNVTSCHKLVTTVTTITTLLHHQSSLAIQIGKCKQLSTFHFAHRLPHTCTHTALAHVPARGSFSGRSTCCLSQCCYSFLILILANHVRNDEWHSIATSTRTSRLCHLAPVQTYVSTTQINYTATGKLDELAQTAKEQTSFKKAI